MSILGSVKKYVQKTNSLRFLVTFYRRVKYWFQYATWLLSGRTAPAAQMYKIQTLRQYAKKYGVKGFVETGTLYGETTAALTSVFDSLTTIELDDKLYNNAVQRFKNDAKVKPVYGDSAKMIPDVLKTLSIPTLFWLDGHYSGGVTAKGDKDTPIMEELNEIFAHSVKNHVLLVDDARCFDGSNDYPTLEELTRIVTSKAPDYELTVKDDIIRICPKPE